MNKTELVAAIAEKSGLTKTDSKKALEGFIAAVTDALKAGEKVTLVGFGTYTVSKRAARQGMNPSTGEAIPIKAKNVAKFKVGAELDDAINA